MEGTAARRLPTALRWLVGAASVLSACSYFLAALLRMKYPFEIGFMDGNFLIQLHRVLHGQPLFVAPTLSYTPMVYAPVYFYVSALAAKIVGFGLAPFRLVSFLSSLGCFGLLYRFVSRETGSRYCGLVSAGLFTAAYREVIYGYDQAGVDMLYILLVVSSVYLLRWRRGVVSLVFAGALGGLSFLTKQTALIILLPLALYALVQGWRSFTAFAGAAAAVAAGGIGLLHVLSGGWSTFYFFSVVATVFSAWQPFLLFWSRDVFLVLPIAVMFCVLFFFDALSRPERRPALFYGCFGAGTAAAAWLYMLNWGAGPGGRAPFYFFLCLTMGLGLGRALDLLRGDSAEHKSLWQSVFFAALAIQFCALVYNPLQVVPREADAEAGRQVVARIAQFPGPVFVPNHPYLPVLAGKPAFAHMMNLRFVLRAKDQRAVAPLRQELHQAFRQRRFSAVITDADWTHEILDEEFRDDLLENYVKSGEISYADNTVFRTVGSLLNFRPQFIYVPKQQPERQD